MAEEVLKMIAHNPWPLPGEKDRKMVGKFHGVEIWSDPNMPDDELRFVQNGKIVEVIKLS